MTGPSGAKAIISVQAARGIDDRAECNDRKTDDYRNYQRRVPMLMPWKGFNECWPSQK
jgi:hypothetical protein